MNTRILSGILLAGVVLLCSIPTPSRADPRDHRRPHARHEHKRYQRHHKHHKHHKHHIHRHDHRQRHHRSRHSGVHIGVRIGRPYGYPPYYPHGHQRIYRHHSYAAPRWHVYYDTHYTPQTILHIEVAPCYGDVYVNGRHLGQAQTFDNGQVRLAVPPGRHAVQLRYNGSAYTQHVYVKPGSTAVVRARLQ